MNMAYLANKREITADPGERKVAIFKIPEKKNPYFSTPMNIVRWQVLEGLIMNKLLFAALLTVAFCTSYALAVDKHYNFEDTEYQAQNLDVRGIAESPEAFLKRVKPLVENESFAADVEKELTVISVPKIVFKETALSDAVEQLNQLISAHNSKRNIFQIPLVRIEPSPPSETTRPSGTKDGQQERITLQLSDVSMKGLIQYIANLTHPSHSTRA